MKLDAEFCKDGNDIRENQAQSFQNQPSSLGISLFILPDFNNAGGGSCKQWCLCSPLQKASKSNGLVTALKNQAQTVSDWPLKNKDLFHFISFSP